MCGIVFQQGDGAVNKRVWKQYKKQRTRGHEGFGVYDGKHITKAAEESRMKRWIKKSDNKTNFLLFHHRYPTSTPNTRKTAHPFTTGHYFGNTEYILVHNGVIRNAEELRPLHEALGIVYQSDTADGKFNDSEALLWEFALHQEKQIESMRTRGDLAFIAVKKSKGENKQLLFGHNTGRPLTMSRNGSKLLISSEGGAEVLPVDTLYSYHLASNRMTSKPMAFVAPWAYTSQTTSNTASTYLPAKTYVTGFKAPSKQSHLPYADDRWGDGDSDEPWFEDERIYYDNGTYDWYDDFEDKWVNSSEYTEYRYMPENYTPAPVKVKAKTVEVDEQVTSPEAFRALGYSDGLYDGALDILEMEITELTDDDGDMGTVRATRQALQDARNQLMNDTNYVNEKSVHPFWLEYSSGGAI